MTKVKRTVSIDAELDRELRQHGEDNFSAIVEDALRRRLQRVKLRRMLDAMDEELGPVPDDVKEQVDREW